MINTIQYKDQYNKTILVTFSDGSTFAQRLDRISNHQTEIDSWMANNTVLPFQLNPNTKPKRLKVPGRGWQILSLPFDSASGKKLRKPDYSDIGNGLRSMKFEKNDELFMSYTVPFDYKINSEAFIQIHWTPDKNLFAGDKIEWEVKYVVTGEGSIVNNDVNTLILTHIADGTELAGTHIITRCTEFQTVNLIGPNTLLMMKVELEDLKLNNGKEVFGIICNIVYESDGLLTNEYSAPFTKDLGVD